MNADDRLPMALKALRAGEKGRQDALAARIGRGEPCTLSAYTLTFQSPTASNVGGSAGPSK
jgi:hypothetical protein